MEWCSRAARGDAPARLDPCHGRSSRAAGGCKSGLHTAGAYPRRLRPKPFPSSIGWGWTSRRLPGITARPPGSNGGDKAWEALRLVLDAKDRLDYEVRLTVFPGAPADRHFTEFLGALRAEGVENFALQEARAQGTDEVFQAMAERWDMPAWRARWDEMADEARSAGFANAVVR